MVDHLNTHKREHILTILRGPIEFVHKNKMCVMNQREGTTADTISYLAMPLSFSVA